MSIGELNSFRILKCLFVPNIKVSKDGQYTTTTGMYRPWVQSYDMAQWSLKFERCFNSEVVTLETLPDNYSKIVLLPNDRYSEFHSQSGFYFGARISQFGRGFSHHYPSHDLNFVGTSKVYRLNLEQGRYPNPLQCNAVEDNVCHIHSVWDLFATGTGQGQAGCRDPRTRNLAVLLDCALGRVMADSEINGPCSEI